MKEPEPLRDVDLLVERGVARSRQAAYRLVREGIVPRGVAVVLGHNIRINPVRLEEWIAGGGMFTRRRP